ncbi:hypothetical protein GX48_04398 [Paracoccidioides brasiliensis]|nr:hypothetical protein GX48_04398 [Paracoccidioides brasiliensis]
MTPSSMRATLGAVAIFAVAVQQTGATYSWDTNKFFPSPSNCDNKCSDVQKTGFDWENLSVGPFTSFGDFDFSGFTCSDQKPVESNFQNKCIRGKLLRGSSSDGPNISYGKSIGFSISAFQITTDQDTDVGFLYTMPDGSTCKHTTPCSKGGSEVQNTQCGGAVSVKFSLPEYSNLDGCGFAIHKIDFDCEVSKTPLNKAFEPPKDDYPTYPTSPSPSPGPVTKVPSFSLSLPWVTPSPKSYSRPVPLPNGTQSPETISEIPSETLSEVPSEYPLETPYPVNITSGTPPPQITPSETTPSNGTTSPTDIISYSTSTVYATTKVTITHCPPEVPSCPAGSTKIVTSTVAISTTICPVTITQTSPGPIATNPNPGYPTPSNTSSSISVSPVSDTTYPVDIPIPTPSTPSAPVSGTTYPINIQIPTPSTPPGLIPDPSYPVGQSTRTANLSILPVSKTSLPGVSVTNITNITVTNYPVINTIISGTSEIIITTSTLSTITVTTTGTVCPGCAIPTSPGLPDTYYVTPSPPATPITGPYPSSALPVTNSPIPSPSGIPTVVRTEAPCPNIVPRCLNTWLYKVPKCSSNSETSCFCPSPDFTSLVIECIQSWGTSKAEIQTALSYFTGICAAYVPENPGIVTAIPSTIDLTPQPPPPSTAAPTDDSYPLTTEPAPAPAYTTFAVSQVISVSGTGPTTVSSMVTVPHVQFITETAAGPTYAVDVGLVPVATALPVKTPEENPPTYATDQASGFTTVPVTPTSSQYIDPFTGAGFSLSVPFTLWMVSGITVVMGLLQ